MEAVFSAFNRLIQPLNNPNFLAGFADNPHRAFDLVVFVRSQDGRPQAGQTLGHGG
jgi:hypothetical protein